MNAVWKNVACSMKFIEPETIPFVIWNTAPFCSSLAGVNQKDVYLDDALKLRVQLNLQRTFPDAMLFPGPFPDFGAALEPSMLGCEVIWPDNDAPYAKRRLKDISEVNGLTVPSDMVNAGLMPAMLRQYGHMWRSLPKEYVDDYGYLDGLGYALGPLETAALVLGYTDFLINLVYEPVLTHRLLEITCDTILGSLRLQQKINGPIKRLFLADHMAHQVSLSMFEEFCFPYYRMIFGEFSNAEVRLYHNEGNLEHIAGRIAGFGANIVHHGMPIKALKRMADGRVTMMGNVPTVETMLNGTEKQVYDAATQCLLDGATGGGFLLSTAGGMAPGTPAENVSAAIRATRAYPKGERKHG